jgi:hypothetical protein
MVGSLKYTELSYLYPSLVPLMLRWKLKNDKRYKLPWTEQIPTEIIQTVGRTVYSEIHKPIIFNWKKDELLQQ